MTIFAISKIAKFQVAEKFLILIFLVSWQHW